MVDLALARGSHLALMELQAAALFRYDAAGRMIATNEPDGDRAPRLLLGRTRDGNLWRFRDDLPADLVRELEAILSKEPVATDLTGPPVTLDAVKAALNAQAPVGATWVGPAWHFPAAIESPSEAIAVTDRNAAVLQAHFPYTARELAARWPCRTVVRDGIAVSACFSARLTADAAEAGVDTVEAYRRRGYAVAVVSAWALAVRESGRIPLYSTSWDNLPSRSVARRLRLVMYGADCSLT